MKKTKKVFEWILMIAELMFRAMIGGTTITILSTELELSKTMITILFIGYGAYMTRPLIEFSEKRTIANTLSNALIIILIILTITAWYHGAFIKKVIIETCMGQPNTIRQGGEITWEEPNTQTTTTTQTTKETMKNWP